MCEVKANTCQKKCNAVLQSLVESCEKPEQPFEQWMQSFHSALLRVFPRPHHPTLRTFHKISKQLHLGRHRMAADRAEGLGGV